MTKLLALLFFISVSSISYGMNEPGTNYPSSNQENSDTDSDSGKESGSDSEFSDEVASPSTTLLDIIIYNVPHAKSVMCNEMYGNLGQKIDEACRKLKDEASQIPLNVISQISYLDKIDIIFNLLSNTITEKGIVTAESRAQGLNLFNFFALKESNYNAFLFAIRTCLEKEAEAQKKSNIVLYTAINSKISFLYDVYTAFNKRLAEIDEKTTKSRFPLKLRLEYDNCTDEVLQRIKQQNDQLPEAGQCLLSTNFSPFANMLQTGESTFQLFLKGNAGGNFNDLLNKFLQATGIMSEEDPKVFEAWKEQYQELYDAYYVPAYSQSGVLLQLIIPNDIAKEITYISGAYGLTHEALPPVPQFLASFIEKTFSQEDDHRVAQFLNEVYYSKISPNNAFFGKKHNPEDSPINLTHVMPQIRVFLHKELMDKVKVKKYWANIVDEDKIEEYKNKLKTLVNQHITFALSQPS